MTTTTFNDTYEIKALLGKGGMSAVYLAEHKRLHTSWAVKEVRKQQGAKFDFLAESNILKRLHHPMLPRIVDIFESTESIYIVEDFVEGITLEEVLKRQGRVDEAQGLQWFRDLCDVLRYLHSQQPHPIIYRDMKPSNVMIQPDGTLKLIDFGIAREFKQESNADTTYIGTKGYAAPEQFGTAQTDARTDIYALGVTMYHILTGKSPYEPPYAFVPARELNPALSHGVEYILNKCVQPEPLQRYQSVDELLDDLDNIYRFDKAYKRFRAVKGVRTALFTVLLVGSLGLTAAGWFRLGAEERSDYNRRVEEAADAEEKKLDEFHALLDKALEKSGDYGEAMSVLEEARELYPDSIEADRAEAYLLYADGRWQECVDFGLAVMEDRDEEDDELYLIMAPAYFELGYYEEAAEGFKRGGDLSAENLRDYAVCLGRLGETDEAEEVLEELLDGAEGGSLDTRYVQGEVFLAQEKYVEAEEAFLEVLGETRELAMKRRCCISLFDLYRKGASMAFGGNFPIAAPATKAVQVLEQAVRGEGLRNDPVLWEYLGWAYYEAANTDITVSQQDYLAQAGWCFDRVLQLGVTKDNIFVNLYNVYYQMGQYENARAALTRFEDAFPQSYMPHALRGILIITEENQKPADSRDFSGALDEYELAGELIRSSDETTYYQMLGSYIEDLRKNDWL